MHKVLVETEFAILCEMGYEVFRPPYLSTIRDQSACDSWKIENSTLPKEVIRKLSQYNFFYNPLSSEIAQLLNRYFDAAIVTIHPDWLKNLLEVYEGKVIYRCFGQVGTVSEQLYSNGAFSLIEGRGNFWFLPHADECLADEQSWLQKYARALPYWVSDDVYPLIDSWQSADTRNESIALSCPNITNIYYQKHFKYLKDFFGAKWFRYYGVQLEPTEDPNVVGTLSRREFLDRFVRESGYLYTYRERNVCYLPPIEMMILGGPVLYLPGSLLHRYFGSDSPGLVKNEQQALLRSNQLIKKDQALISEIVESQSKVRNRYLKPLIESKWKEVFLDILEGTAKSNKSKIFFEPKVESRNSPPVLMFGHFSHNYVHSNGEYSAVNGIPRVMRQFVKALNDKMIPVIVTSYDKDATIAYGFFASDCKYPELLKILPLPQIRNGLFDLKRFFTFQGLLDAGYMELERKYPQSLILIAGVLKRKISIGSLNDLRRFLFSLIICSVYLPFAIAKTFKRLLNLNQLALNSGNWRYMIVPHYFLFPESLRFNSPLLMYLPDYIPHFFRDKNHFPEEEKHAKIGKELCARAKRILTNSQYTQKYLPETDLKVSQQKIISFVMPYLNSNHSTSGEKQTVSEDIVRKMAGKRYLFYPTQPQPNKRLDLLINSWILASEAIRESELYLVLTALSLPEHYLVDVKEKNLLNKLLIFPSVNDSTLNWLYQNAVCLGFSSELEGNFPTQVMEALLNHCPIVTMEHPLIISELGEDSKLLLTAPAGDLKKFSELVIFAMNHREEVLGQQEILKQRILPRFDYKVFAENVWKLDELMLKK